MNNTYTVRDIMDRYGVSQATVLHWLATGQLQSLNVGRDPGKKRARYRIPESAIEHFELSRTATPPAPKTRRRKQSSDVVKFY